MWLLNLYADGAHDALPAVRSLVVLLEEIAQSLRYRLPERCQVGTAVARILAIHKGRNVLSVGISVGDYYFDVFALQMYRRIERSLAQVLLHQVGKSVFGFVVRAVQSKGKSFL